MEKARVRLVILLSVLACAVVVCVLCYKFIWPPDPGFILIPADTQFTLEHKLLLNGYVNQTYGRLAPTEGHAAAMKVIGQKLDSLETVESWRLEVRSNQLWITWIDGEETASMLPFWSEEVKRQIEEADRKK